MTVNNATPADLSVATTTALLERLTAAAASHASAGEVLLKETRTRRHALERRHGEVLEALDQQQAKESAVIDDEWLGRWEQTRGHLERRHLRIEKAERNTQRDLPKRIEAARGAWLGKLQHQRMTQEREIGLEARRLQEDYEAQRGRITHTEAEITKLIHRIHQAFNGSLAFKSLLKPANPVESAPPDTASALLAVEESLPELKQALAHYREAVLPRFFSILTPTLLVVFILGGAVILAGSMGFEGGSLRLAALTVAVGLVLVLALYLPAMRRARPAAAVLADQINQAVNTCAQLQSEAKKNYSERLEKVKAGLEAAGSDITSQWSGVEAVDTDFAAAARQKWQQQVPRLAQRNDAILQKKRLKLEVGHTAEAGACEAKFSTRRSDLLAKQATELAELAAAESARWNTLKVTWQEIVPPTWEKLAVIRHQSPNQVKPWSQDAVAAWRPPEGLLAAMPFASLKVDLAAHAGALPPEVRLPMPGPLNFDLPIALTFPQQGSLLLQSAAAASSGAALVLNNIILRLLSASRPGKISFTIIDPVGLGQNFGGLMNLSDYEDSLINHRIWTQREQIDERLGMLSGHIEKVIQMYLRNEFDNISEYNNQAGVVAEKYHFLVIADFPANFSETAVKRLESIVSSGPRCGVFTLMHTDLRATQPEGFTATTPAPDRIILRQSHDRWELSGLPMTGLALTPETPPTPELALALLHRVGKASIDAGRVEVPFSQISPAPADYWMGDTTNELRIAIGRTGAIKRQILAIGKGTRQHALFAGKTGSGKSTLFHVIITNLALTCSPDQVEFYLIDFKKGVEFKCYANKKLPHARVVAIESDREFALSVLHRLDEELKRRGDRFRQINVQDLAGYVRSGATEPMPRSLLIIDEFQEFFTEDDTIAQTASLLLDRIVRQGRAFGIHVLLGSQTLGGAYSLARATLGQMSIRVALQCNEADAFLIMDDNNPAARLLSRPGEGIYNDATGSVEGNSPFQVVWLPDGERDRLLEEIHQLAVNSGRAPMVPIVFEGNAPADFLSNTLMRQVLGVVPSIAPASGRCWLGAPNAIKGPTEAVFHRQSGQHLLIVGQREEASLTMLGLSLLALAGQYPAGTAQFVFLHSATPGTPEGDFIEQLAAAVPALTLVRPNEVVSAITALHEELKIRATEGAEAGIASYVFIHGLHRFKKLRQEDDFSFSVDRESTVCVGGQFNELITGGSSQGIHLLVSLDSYNNVNRSFNRKTLTEFEMRVVFQMSANDSASLIDSPAAGNLGLHRAFFYNEHEGTLETFRPYVSPDTAWFEETAQILTTRIPALGLV